MMQRLRGLAQRELRSSLRCWRAVKPSTNERGLLVEVAYGSKAGIPDTQRDVR
jgi:hypothetical protein